MEPNRGNQYDDDLTVGLDDIADESFDTGYVDLFEYAGAEESPIYRLKNLMLSIEWEITDQILTDFNDELVKAQQTWADDPVKVVYSQALQKITKYIYQKKSDAHHNAMKVLLAFFYDLEKIVLDTTISSREKEEILLADVQKFERFKQQIGITAAAAPASEDAGAASGPDDQDRQTPGSKELNPDLYNLKAYILSIDWEITDKELSEVSKEVKRLQTLWAGSKPQALLLQGIDAIGGYIKLMKSASHADAFKLLNSFYQALETVVDGSLSAEQTKELLISEAERFNRFKDEIGDTITPEAIAEHKAAVRLAQSEAAKPAPEPAAAGETELVFKDTSEFEQTSVDDDFGGDESFSEEALEKVASFFGDMEKEQQPFTELSAEEALRGVEVETEADDDSDEEALPILGDGVLAPALADLEDDGPVAPGLHDDFPAGTVPGVDVETEADDDSEEAPLPLADGELAPALFVGGPEGQGIGTEDEPVTDEISKQVDEFFAAGGLGPDSELEEETPLSPALSDYDDSQESAPVEGAIADDIEDRLDNFLSEEAQPAGLDPASDAGFVSLKKQVDSLKDGIDRDKLGVIQSDLARLEDVLADKPIEKTLTHLISAVVGTIGKKSGQFDNEAVDLLHSVYNNLETIRSASLDQHQALIVLSNETAKILKWQQRMVSD